MRRPFTVVAAALFATIAVLAPRLARGQTSSGSSRLDSLAAQLVALELQRVSPTLVTAPSAGPRDLSSQIAALHEQLLALPAGATAEREATNRVVLALDARGSSVQARLQQLRLVYTEAHPTVRQTQAEVRAIDQRIAEIRSAK
jgi:uncharacterized protein involved in exopolysaccharide biosynthesis